MGNDPDLELETQFYSFKPTRKPLFWVLREIGLCRFRTAPGNAGANRSGGSGSKALITGTKEADYAHWKRQLKHHRLKSKISAYLLPFAFSLIAAFIIRCLPFYF